MNNPKEIIADLKKETLKMSLESKEGHLASAFSILDILYVLYHKVLRIDPKHPSNPKRDRFILSKGHASLGLYAILANLGFFSKRDLATFCQYESKLGGHPDRNKVPGVEVSSGSLGHGFPMAVGIALGLKITKNPARVYALVGDGESNEGTVWESALLASHHHLDNLCCIVDQNHSSDRALSLENLEHKFTSFGWECISIDGHAHKEIEQALKKKHSGKPLVIIANTIKGFGSKMMENNPAWHHKSPTQEEYEVILEELS